MRRLAIAALGVGLLVTACGPTGSGTLGSAPTGSRRPSPSASASTERPSVPATPPTSGTAPNPTGTARPPGSPPVLPSGSPSGRSLTFQIWLVRDGRLFVTARTRPATVATGRLALTTLIAGPTAVETAAGVGSAIDPGTTFDIALRSGVATVDLPAAFYAGGRDLARRRQAQVVYTLTQYPTISKVGFVMDGRATSAPVGRAEYADLLPPIVVTNPVIGARLSSPVTVSGTADVFEATVSVRVRDARGAAIATTFTTATCGTGCRGSYAVAVRYRVASAQHGTVEVFSVSPKDGSDLHLVRIPVALTP